MRILFDQGTPASLRSYLSGHEVATAAEMLDAAEQQFDVLITTDQALRT